MCKSIVCRDEKDEKTFRIFIVSIEQQKVTNERYGKTCYN